MSKTFEDKVLKALDKLQIDVESLKTSMTKLEKRVESLEISMAKLGKKVDKLDAKVDQVIKGMSPDMEKINRHELQIVDHEKRIISLEQIA